MAGLVTSEDSVGSADTWLITWQSGRSSRHILQLTGLGSESDCGSDRTEDDPGIIPDLGPVELLRHTRNVAPHGWSVRAVAAHRFVLVEDD